MKNFCKIFILIFLTLVLMTTFLFVGCDNKEIVVYNGQDGVSITGVEINENGELIISFSKGSPINVGKVVGESGNTSERDNLTLATILLGNYSHRVPSIDTKTKTISLPYDTNIVDKRLPNGWICLKNPDNYQPIEFTWDLNTSAVCIYYDITENKLIAMPMTSALSVDCSRYILLFAIRIGKQSTVSSTCPCYIDGRLYGESNTNILDRNLVKLNENIKVISHRGNSSANLLSDCGVVDVPENTLAAFKIAKQRGFEYVECDVTFTSDGVPVLLHDTTINRTARNADGTVISTTINISDITYQEVLNYDFGIWISNEFVGEKIPTFEEFIVLCKRIGLKPYIELKGGTEEQIKVLINMVKRYAMTENSTWVSFNSDKLKQISKELPKARLGLSGGIEHNNDIIEKIKSLRTESNEVFYFAWYENAKEDIVLKLVSENIPLEVYGSGSVNAIINVIDNYTSGYCVDSSYVESILYDEYID